MSYVSRWVPALCRGGPRTLMPCLSPASFSGVLPRSHSQTGVPRAPHSGSEQLVGICPPEPQAHRRASVLLPWNLKGLPCGLVVSGPWVQRMTPRSCAFSHTWEALGRNSCQWVSLWRRRLPPFPFSPWTPRVSSPHVDLPPGVEAPDGPGGCPGITSPPPGGPTCSLSYL